MKLNPIPSCACVLAAFMATGAQAQAIDTFKKITDSGTIAIGVREAAGALSFSVENGKPVGFHIDICQQVVEDLQKQLNISKINVRYTSVTNANRIPLVQNGTVDMECGSTSNTAARQKDVAFAYTLFVEQVKILVRGSSGITSLKELAGKTVVTTTGGTALQHLRRYERAANVEFKNVHARDNAEAFLLLESNRADAFVNDSQILASLVSTSREKDAYRIVGEPLSIEPIAIMVRKDDPTFKKAVDDSIKSMVESGLIAKLYDKWFMQPIPPRNVSLNLPASTQTRAAWASLNDIPAEEFQSK